MLGRKPWTPACRTATHELSRTSKNMKREILPLERSLAYGQLPVVSSLPLCIAFLSTIDSGRQSKNLSFVRSNGLHQVLSRDDGIIMIYKVDKTHVNVAFPPMSSGPSKESASQIMKLMFILRKLVSLRSSAISPLPPKGGGGAKWQSFVKKNFSLAMFGSFSETSFFHSKHRERGK